MARFHFDFVGRSRTWFLVSFLLLVLSLASLAIQGLNLGIDFTGGLNLRVRFQHPADTTVVRRFLDSEGQNNNVVQALGSAKSGNMLISLPALPESTRVRLQADMARKVGPYSVISLDKVTGAVSQEQLKSGLLAVAAASLGIIVYMAFRFDFRFALTGIVAVFYDVLITLGAISLLRAQVMASFVAAVLTIIGYSINDRIIIFDRIRENLRTKRKESLAQVVNKSLNQTLARSIYTAVMVILAMAALYVFGGSSTRVLALTLIIGVFFGAYSSIFLASPLWLWWMEAGRAKNQGGKREDEKAQ